MNDHCAGLMRSDGLVSFLCARDTNLAGDVPSFFSGTTIACLRHFHESRNIVKRQKCKLVAYIFSLDTCHVNLDGTAPAALAAYVLHEVKNNVVGCGGHSLILALEPNGIEMASSEKLAGLENWLGTQRMPSDALLSKILKFGPILESAVSSPEKEKAQPA
ncbi:MAG: hypothetical protein DMG38_16155 [Acidobacteria bacterium]|nr:MAG: hypothetical protein DMG38_16155 [Acidobacteriota bacterium]